MLANHPAILLVEDSDVDAHSISEAFRKAHIANPIVRVGSTTDAKDYLLEKEGDEAGSADEGLPVFVLLNSKLGRASGYDLLQWIRRSELLSKLPVVIVSASGSAEERACAESMGANGFFQKHLHLETLIAMVQSIGASWLLQTGSNEL